jgi:putative ABC transport system permease protein
MSSFTRGYFKSGIESVRNAKFRNFWTMLGIIIGVASVITVVAIGQGVKNQISGQIQRYDKNLITVKPAQLKTAADSGNNGLNILSGLGITAPLSEKDVGIIAKTKGVAASAPLTVASGTTRATNGVYRDGLVLGTTSDLPGLINQSMAYGIFLTDEDVGSNMAVLGQHAVDEMFDVDVPLGRSFTFQGREFIVQGIFNQFNNTPLSQQADFNSAIFIPNDVAEDISRESAPTYTVLVRPSDGQSVEAVAGDIHRNIKKAHGGQENFEVLIGNQAVTSSQAVLNLLTRLIAGTAAISLLVAGIGIMNVMLVSVAERMHEIGIRKAVGATNRQILSQFLIESSLLSFVGGVIGIMIAYLVNIVLRIATNLKPEITWEIVLIASGVSLIIGVLFGTIPAFTAARKDPIEALRSE